MSYVVTIKRAPDTPPLTLEEIQRLVATDSSLSGGDKEPIVWTSPTDGRKRYINVERDHLWTDDLSGDDDSQVLAILDKLRSMAGCVDARVFGEGDGDITEPGVDPPKRAGCAMIIACAVTFFLIVMLILTLRRDPRRAALDTSVFGTLFEMKMPPDILMFLLRGGHPNVEERKAKGLWPSYIGKSGKLLSDLAGVIKESFDGV